jgi:hypothetical protein
MRPHPRTPFVYLASPFCLALLAASAHAQAGNLSGTVTDATGALIPGATVSIDNAVSHYSRQTVSDSAGHYQFTNLPLNPYQVTLKAPGFSPISQSVAISSSVPVVLRNVLAPAAVGEVVNVEATPGDLTEDSSTFHTDIDRGGFAKIPLESSSSGLSSLVTQSSPGIATDSNGQMHGLGDHASNTVSIDGQANTDQSSKVFSNQLPVNAVQSLEVIAGAPPAEYGGKTSLVIDVTTRSGQGVTKPTGSVSLSYGSFGSENGSIDLAYGGQKWGNFFEIDGQNSGRFLDSPEFVILHDKGNELNFFDRVDRQLTEHDAIRLNGTVSRSWFQTPNAYDATNVLNVIRGGATAAPIFGNVGDADQRSKIVSFDISPTYTHTLNDYSIYTLGGWVRRDGYNYYPSGNPLADKSAPNLQNQTITQARSLLNAGVRSDISYVRGIHNIKIGGAYTQTFLDENDTLGVVSNLYNAPCTDQSGNAVYGFSNPSQCSAAGDLANTAFLPVLLPYDLTRGGSQFNFRGHTDVKELGLYAQDQIKVGAWMFNVGLRGDFYNGLATMRQAEPRVGLAYTVKPTGTVLRLSYARTLESPFNENLVLSSRGCGNAVLAPLLSCSPGVSTTLEPGFRNEFHAGLQQAFGKHLVFSGEYIWKYTHNSFDFSVLGNTPITFPIDWHNSKIPGYALRLEVPSWHNVSAYLIASSVAARFFPPQVAGAGATIATPGGALPFRIDHDERFNQTTHLQYQLPQKRAPWLGFNWRYDSGLTASSAPCYNVTDPNSICQGLSTTLNGQPAIDLSGYTADEQFEAGLICNGFKATPQQAIPGSVCLASQLTSKLLSVPAPGTEDDDRHPSRIAPRSVFDLSVGDDDAFGFHQDKQKISLKLTAVNLANKYALYNFLSTFSGTHYLTPRSLTGEVAFHF